MPPINYYSTIFNMPAWDFFLFFGFIIVMLLALIRKPKEFPVTRLGIFFCFMLILYFGLMGAKVLFLVLHGNEIRYIGKPVTQIFQTAGYAFFGTIFFEFIAIFGFAKIRPRAISFFELADYLAPFLILHQVFVRIGCYLNGCCFGKPTDLPWACIFPHFDLDLIPRHPTQLYSVIFLLFIFVFMRFIYPEVRDKKGLVFFGTYALYGFFRFFVEFLRVDSFPVLGEITLAQVVCASVFLICFFAILLVLALNKKRKII